MKPVSVIKFECHLTSLLVTITGFNVYFIKLAMAFDCLPEFLICFDFYDLENNWD